MKEKQDRKLVQINHQDKIKQLPYNLSLEEIKEETNIKLKQDFQINALSKQYSENVLTLLQRVFSQRIKNQQNNKSNKKKSKKHHNHKQSYS